MIHERKMITVEDDKGNRHQTLDMRGYVCELEPGFRPEGYDGPIPWEAALANAGWKICEDGGVAKGGDGSLSPTTQRSPQSV